MDFAITRLLTGGVSSRHCAGDILFVFHLLIWQEFQNDVVWREKKISEGVGLSFTQKKLSQDLEDGEQRIRADVYGPGTTIQQLYYSDRKISEVPGVLYTGALL